MIIDNICVKKKYVSNGVEKVSWLRVGSLKTASNGNRYIELNMFPDTSFYVFEKKEENEKAPKTDGQFQDLSADGVPF